MFFLLNDLFCVKRILPLFIIICSLFTGCIQTQPQEINNFILQPGDILFQDLDCGPFCDAIEKVTRGYNGANFSHVVIVARDENADFIVIEAVSTGVGVTPVEVFLGRSLDEKQRPKVVVGRLKDNYKHLISSALIEALALKGKPYDSVFDITNDSYYCSELIYEIFSRANNNMPIFKLEPMTFKDPDTGNIFPVWEEYFSKLGVSVPEGREGLNPGSISRSPALIIIDAYGTPTGWGEKSNESKTGGRFECVILRISPASETGG